MAASPFRPAIDLMTQYAQYHRDKRNIATHFVGIPLIVFAISVLLARASVGGMTLAWIVWGFSSAWYLTRGNLVLGLATSVVNAVLTALAHPLASGGTASWLIWGIGAFIAGWIIQFIGHYYEGRKPAFVDDVIGLLVGPMFVVGEWLFALGWGRDLLAEIERRVNEENARPKKRYLSPFTREAAFATYVDSLRRRVEAQGTANFPTLAGKKLYGELTMTITVNFDGRLLSTVIDESSGQAVLDKRAKAIVASVGNFGTFTDAMRKEHADQIVIRPHFRFAHDGSVELSSQ